MQGYECLSFSLEDLGLQVSTGPVVDFRFREYITQNPESGSVPLLYPTHMNGVGIDWPVNSKKPNAIRYNAQTEKIIIPNGYYTIVKRFSPKEEKKGLWLASLTRINCLLILSDWKTTSTISTLTSEE